MRELDIALIKKRSVSGMIALTSRTFVLQIIAFSATFLLTIFLSPAIFGVFYVVSAVISFLGYFSDIGLAAALIQKKSELSDDDLVTTFTLQQALVTLVVGLAFLCSPFIVSFYVLEDAGRYLLYGLLISFFLSSLKTIPSVLLERKLEFHKLVLPQILETLGFYVVAVFLSWKGFGISSFTWAVLVRAIVGLIAIYYVSPWRMRLGFSLGTAKKLMTFGLPFQFNSFLALLKDDLLTLFLGKILPLSEVGYIGWAKKWAEIPLRLIMDSIIRVTFPAFSRLQHSKELLRKAIEKTLFGLSVAIFPISISLLFFVRPLIDLIPRYSKWEPALVSFYLFTIASAVASLSTPLTNALNALGKIKTTLWLMVLWTFSTWILTVFLVSLIGYNGVALSLLLITSTLALVVYLVKRVASFSFWRSIRSPAIGIAFQSLFYMIFIQQTKDFFPLFIIGSVGFILYVSVIWVFERKQIASIMEGVKS